MGDYLTSFNQIMSCIGEIADIIERSSLNASEDCLSVTSNFELYDLIICFVAPIVLIVFSLMSKRVSCQPDTCCGRPGLALPMNVLNDHDNIVLYTFIFLCLSEDIFQIIFDMKAEFPNSSPIEKFFLKLIFVAVFSVLTYPLFAASYQRLLSGYIIAIVIFSGSLISETAHHYYVIQCLIGTERIPYFFIAAVYLSIDITVLFCFIRLIVLHVKYNGCHNQDSKIVREEDKKACFKYVKELLKENYRVETEKKTLFETVNLGKIKTKLSRTVYLKISGFKIPPRLAIGLFVGIFFAYRIFMDHIMGMTPTAWNMIYFIRKKYVTTKMDIGTAFKIASGNYSEYSPTQIKNAYRFLALFYTHLLVNCLITAVVVGMVNSVIQTFLILRNYRLQFHRISKRGFSSIIAIRKAPNPSGLISGFVKYSGYQAAYLLWGIFMVISFMFVFLFVSIGVFLLPLIYLENSWIREKCVNYAPVLIATIIFNFLQTLLIKFVFLKERGRLMEVNNRRLFMIYTHCAFFLNAMMGLFNSLKRIIIWIVSGVFCFCRIDFCALPDYLHNFDPGYMSYIGFLYTDQYHNNPILKCFSDLLLDHHKEVSKCFMNDEDKQLVLKRRIRRKWHLAFTLHNNIQLQIERKKKENKFINEINV